MAVSVAFDGVDVLSFNDLDEGGNIRCLVDRGTMLCFAPVHNDGGFVNCQ